MNKEVISLKEIVGGGYSDFWHFKGEYTGYVKGHEPVRNPKQRHLI